MRRIGPTAPIIDTGERDEIRRDSLGQLIAEHHAMTGHGPTDRTMVPSCEACGLLLEALWSLRAESLAS